MSWQPEIDELHRREKLAKKMGGEERVAKHRARGKLTVRERIERLLDPGTFHETGALAGKSTYENGKLVDFRPANFLLGTGYLKGRKVVVGADDFTVRGGAADGAIVGKQVYAERMAHDLQLPMIRLVDGTGGGGSVKTLDDLGHTYVPVNPAWDLVVDNMGIVPVAAACLGSVAGLGAARVAASHFSVMVEGISQLWNGERKSWQTPSPLHRRKSDRFQRWNPHQRSWAGSHGFYKVAGDCGESPKLLCEWVRDAYDRLPQLLGKSTHTMRP